MVVERELKLEAPPTFSLARLVPDWHGYVVAPAAIKRLHTVYYDTEDLRLAHWGVSLRFRRDEGWTLKLPVPHDSRALYREEHVFPGDGTTIPARALDLATAYLRGAAPVPVAELRTLRASRRLRSGDGGEVAEVVEDDVRVVEGTHVVRRFRQIEIELGADAADDLLDHLGDLLRSEGAGKPDPVSKDVRALGERAEGHELDAPPVGARSRVSDVVRAAFAASVERLVRFDAKLRLHADEESIHQARVAVRRLRSDLRTFLPVLDATRACALRERLSWLQDGLSEARDADVLLIGLRRRGETLPGTDRRFLDDVLAPFGAARERAYAHVGDMLRQPRYVALLQELVETAKQPPLTPAADDDACDAAPALVREAWKTLRKRVRRRMRPPEDRELHRIRIAAKRVRYAAEALEAAVGGVARDLAAAAESIQTILGDQHDAVVARDRLRALAGRGAHAFVAGEVAALAHGDACAGRDAWRPAWRAARREHRRFRRTF
ncbi:MAG: CHAD domain-containing protein [Candidatus Eremiobacteraeota bacterium]|nr:CHAD domain-containing protein [Candidatus Eremiobacteraeota bacterium]